MLVRKYKENAIKPSAKRNFSLFCGRNVPTITLKIINYLQGTSSKMIILEYKLEELVNEKKNFISK